MDPPPLETDLELLTVTVSSKGRGITDLGKDRFQVLEDGIEQKISYFWVDSRPISVGFVIDGSSAINDLMNEAIRGVGPAFLKSKRMEDEYFVIVFSNAPAMTVTYTTDAKLMPHVFPQSGEQPLYDAIYNGLDAMKEAANPRRVLLVVTAAGDNGKGQTDDQLVNYAIKQPVQVYSLDLGGGTAASNTLDLLASVTGGQAIVSADSSFLIEAIASELAQALGCYLVVGTELQVSSRYSATAPVPYGQLDTYEGLVLSYNPRGVIDWSRRYPSVYGASATGLTASNPNNE